MSNEPSKLRQIIENDASVNSFGANSLTVIYTTQRELLTKRILADGKEKSYDQAFTFYCAPVDLSTTEKLLALLQALAPSRHACIILGAISPHVDRKQPTRRLSNPRPGTPIPNFRATPRSVFALDVDSIEAPQGLDLRNLRGAAEYVRRQLPAAFHDVEMIAVATSGYLRKPGMRFRMWVRLSRPLFPKEMKRWMILAKPAGAVKPLVDLSVFTPVQPNYTADPMFDDPSMNPLPGGRMVMLPGNPCVDPPSEVELFDLNEWFERPNRRRRQDRTQSPRGPGTSQKDGGESEHAKQPGSDGCGKGAAGASSANRDGEAVPPTGEGAPEEDAELDRTFAHLWGDDEAVALARSHLAQAPPRREG